MEGKEYIGFNREWIDIESVMSDSVKLKIMGCCKCDIYVVVTPKAYDEIKKNKYAVVCEKCYTGGTKDGNDYKA